MAYTMSALPPSFPGGGSLAQFRWLCAGNDLRSAGARSGAGESSHKTFIKAEPEKAWSTGALVYHSEKQIRICENMDPARHAQPPKPFPNICAAPKGGGKKIREKAAVLQKRDLVFAYTLLPTRGLPASRPTFAQIDGSRYALAVSSCSARCFCQLLALEPAGRTPGC